MVFPRNDLDDEGTLAFAKSDLQALQNWLISVPLMRDFRLKSGLLATCFCFLACASPPPPAKPTIAKPAPPLASTSTAATVADPCAPAAALRDRATGLLEQGRLDRAWRLIRKANATCPQNAPRTWTVELDTLVSLSRFAEARELIKTIRNAASVDPAIAAHAKAAEETITQLEQPPADRRAAQAKMWESFRAADALADKGDPDSLRAAIEKYLTAWREFHPNGQALVSAGLLEKKLGRAKEARQLFDRALVELEREMKTSARIVVPNGLPEGVESIAYSPDGRRIAVGQPSGKISILDASTFEVLSSFWAASRRPVMSLAFSSDGRRLVSTAAGYLEKGDVDVWDLPARMLVHHWPKTASAAAFVDSSTLVAIGDWQIQFLDLATRTVTHKIPIEESLASLAVSPDGKRVVVNLVNYDLKTDISQSFMGVWDTQTRRRVGVLRGHQDNINRITYSPDGKWIASTSDDDTVKIWNAKDLTLRTSIKAESDVNGVAFSIDGKKVVFGVYGHGSRLVDLVTGKTEAELSTKALMTSALAFSPDGARIVWGGPHEDDGARLNRWSLRDNRQEDPDTRIATAIQEAHWSADGKVLGFGGWDHTARLVLLGETTQLITRKHDLYVSGVSFSPDGKLFASSSDDKTVRVWEVPSGNLYRKLDTSGGMPIPPVATVAFLPDGRRLAAGLAEGTTLLWDVEKAQTDFLLHSQAPGSMISRISFTSDSKWALTTGGTDSVYLWEVDQMRVRYEARKNSTYVAAFSPDDQWAVTANDSGELLVRYGKTLKGKSIVGRHEGGLRDAVFSRDGAWIFSTGADLTVRSWNVADAKPGFSTALDSEPTAMSLSKDGQWITIPMEDGSIAFLRASDGKVMGTLYALNARDAIVVSDAAGRVDVSGSEACEARKASICRIGPVSVPLEVCAERGLSTGLLGKMVAAGTIEEDPERVVDWAECPAPSK